MIMKPKFTHLKTPLHKYTFKAPKIKQWVESQADGYTLNLFAGETNLDIQEYNLGLVLINDKFVVSLTNNKWRIKNKNKWYLHKEDIDHFVNKYILGENNETNN